MAGTGRIRVILVERNPLIAKALQQSLKGNSLPQVPGILAPAELGSPKLSFMNGDLPLFVVDEDSYSSVYQVLRAVAQRFPDSKRIVLGHHFDVPQLFSLILEGAHGFLTYEEVKAKLGRAITAVSQGRLWLQSGKCEEICLYVQETWRSKTHAYLRFTKRQKQIIDLLQYRLSNKEIASQLSISENTVKFHLGKVFSKVGARSRESVPNFLKLTGT